jgi:hypothetical protein
MTQKEEIPQTEPAEIEQLIEQVKQSNLEQSAVDKLERLLRLILRLVELLQYKNVSLKRLRTMVFGPRTEKRKTSEHHQEEDKEGRDRRRSCRI